MAGDCSISGKQEEAAHQPRKADHLDGVGGGEELVLEQTHLDHRLFGAQLEEGEDDEQQDACAAEGQHSRVAEAVGAGFGEAVHQRGETGGREQQAGDVEAAGVLLLLLLQEEAGEGEAQHADGDVDQEDPAPVDVLDEVAAEDRAAGRRDDHRDHQDGRGLGALVRGEGAEEHGGADRA